MRLAPSRLSAAVCLLLGTTEAFAPQRGNPAGFRLRATVASEETWIVMSWDGCVAETVDWRVEMGVAAALRVWPDPLQSQMDGYRDEDNVAWLYNKLRALAPFVGTLPSGDGNNVHSITCEYAFAARLVLEEQALDAGHSDGCTGKYASQFHPRNRNINDDIVEDDIVEDEQGNNSIDDSDDKVDNGSRPLTVGEIAENWSGLIRDTIGIKYHANYNDPLPILQGAIDDMIQQDGENMIGADDDATKQKKASSVIAQPTLTSRMRRRLMQPIGDTTKLVVLVHHESDLPAAERSFHQINDDSHGMRDAFHIRTVRDVQSIMDVDVPFNSSRRSGGSQGRSIFLFCPNDSSWRADICRTTMPAPTKSLDESQQQEVKSRTVYAIESSWPRLQQWIPSFGDAIPKKSTGDGATPIESNPNLSLSLNLASFDDTVDAADTQSSSLVAPQHVRAAMMNPWTGVMTLEDLDLLLMQDVPVFE